MNRDPERARRKRWTSWLVAGALLAVTLLTGALLLVLDERRAFDAERRDAAEARRDVEQLLTETLQDLQMKLDDAGRLHLLEGAARESLAYYGRRQEGVEGCAGWQGCDDREILGQARAITQAGLILRSLGDLDGALAAFERNRFRFRGLIAIEVRPSWQLELSDAHRRIAEVHASRGETAEALSNARSAAALSGALAPDAPSPEPPLAGPVPDDWAEIHAQNLLQLEEAQRAMVGSSIHLE